MIRVLVVDDHPVVRATVVDLLESTGRLLVVGEAVDGLEAIERAGQAEPDVVLMDVAMPNMSGIEATRRLTADRPGTSVLMFSAEARPGVVRAAREAGAIGFVTKGCRARDVLRAIYAASEGRSVWPAAAKSPRAP